MKNGNQRNVYEQLRKACKRNRTSLTKVLEKTNNSTSVTGGWKSGQSPRLYTIMDIAEFLNISLDELCYGIEDSNLVKLNDEQKEWLFIIDHIPSTRLEMCKDFLKTHAMIPPKSQEKTLTS